VQIVELEHSSAAYPASVRPIQNSARAERVDDSRAHLGIGHDALAADEAEGHRQASMTAEIAAQGRAARIELLAEEKAMTRARDARNAKHRELPMVRIDKDYAFDGPHGTAGLLDLFEGRRQLIVGHFMFDPTWDDGCSSCSAGADEVSRA